MNKIVKLDHGIIKHTRKKRQNSNKKTYFEMYRSPKTIQDYMFYLKDFLDFIYEGNGSFSEEEIIPLMKDIDKSDVEQYISSLIDTRNLKKTSINKIISALKSLYRELEEYGIENPFSNVRLFKTTRNIDNILKISSEDIKNIIDNFKIKNEKSFRNYVILNTLYYTGMRSDELLHMEFRHILSRDDNYFLKLEKTKSGKEQYKPLHPELIQILLHYKEEMQSLFQISNEEILNHYIFCSNFKDNQKLSYKSLYNIIKNMGLIIEKSISPHNIRHAIATELSSNGADLIEIRDFLGHSDTRVTEIYIDAKSIIEKKVLSKIPKINK